MYFRKYQEICAKSESDFDAMDTELDTLVYQLYGLSDDQVALVERS